MDRLSTTIASGRQSKRNEKLWGGTAIDPQVAAARVRNALAARNKPTAIGEIEGRWCALKGCFVDSASVARAFREDRTFLAGPAQTIMRELLARMTFPDIETNVENMVHIKGGERRTLGWCMTQAGTQRRLGGRWKRLESSANTRCS